MSSAAASKEVKISRLRRVLGNRMETGANSADCGAGARLVRKLQLRPLYRLKVLHKIMQLTLRLRRRTAPSLFCSDGPAGEFPTGEFGLVRRFYA